MPCYCHDCEFINDSYEFYKLNHRVRTILGAVDFANAGMICDALLKLKEISDELEREEARRVIRDVSHGAKTEVVAKDEVVGQLDLPF